MAISSTQDRHRRRPPGQTFDLYKAEGRAAVATLRARTDVDSGKLFVIGHSEGAMHAMRVADAEGPPLAGLTMLSGGGRRFGDIQVAQIESQLHGDVHAPSARLRAAIEDFIALSHLAPSVLFRKELRMQVGNFTAAEIGRDPSSTENDAAVEAINRDPRWVAEFDQQLTPSLIDSVRNLLRPHAFAVACAGRKVDDHYIKALVADVLGDTWLAT